MAWAIQTVRGGGYLTLGTPYQPVVGDVITWGGYVDLSTATWQFFINTYTSGNDWISLSSGKLYVRLNGVSKTGTTVVPDGTYFEFKLEVTATEYIFYIDSTEQYRFSSAVAIDPILGLSNASAALGVSSKAQFLTVDGKHNWDATASDHSNTGSQPILIDTVGSNNATGVNFPTDGSAWVDLGGGGVVDGDVSFSLPNLVVNSSGSATLPQPTGSASFTINQPLFLSAGSATLPQPVGAISLTLTAPSFIVSGSASLPQPVGSVSFTIDAPTVSASGSATTTTPSGGISITINKPIFIGSGAATLPSPIGGIDVGIPAPIFALTGSVTIPTWSASGNITLNKPLFSVTGSTTLPQPNGSVELSLTSPVFNVSGSVSGIVIINGTDSTITLEAKLNLLTLETKSNTITL